MPKSSAIASFTFTKESKMNKGLNVLEATLNTLGVCMAITDIEQWFNIALLIVSILAIVLRVFFEVKQHIKEGKHDEIDDDIMKGVNEIKEILPRKEKEDETKSK